MPSVSWLAVIVGTLLGFVLGASWYGPLFGRAWMAERRSSRLLLINGGYHAVRFGLIGLAFGLLG